MFCARKRTVRDGCDCAPARVFVQSWDPSVPSRAFGMLIPGKAALAIRILTLLHFCFSTAMFVGW